MSNPLKTNTSSNYESLLWDFGDGNQSTDTDPTHIYTASGNYTIILTAYNNDDCFIDSSTASIQISIPTGINQSSKEKKILEHITDLLGRPALPVPNQILLYKYSDGSVEKRLQVDR